MKKKIKELDFSNQLIFVGIDVHKNNWTVTIQIGGLLLREKMKKNPAFSEAVELLEDINDLEKAKKVKVLV